MEFSRRKVAWFRMTIESAYEASYYVGISELAVDDQGGRRSRRRECGRQKAPGRTAAPSAPRRSAPQSPGGAGPSEPDEQSLVARLAALPAAGDHPRCS